MNEESNTCSVPVFSSSFRPLNTDSVRHASHENVMQVIHRATTAHHINTSCQRKVNNEHSHHSHVSSVSAASSMTIPSFSSNVLYSSSGAPVTLPQSVFSAPTSCQVDTPVWTAVSTVNSRMYYNNRINNELTNFDFMPLVHSKVKMCRSVRSDTLNNEPAVYGTTVFHGITASNEMRTHQTMKLNNEPAVYGTIDFCSSSESCNRIMCE